MNDSFDRIILSAWILLASGVGMVLYLGLNAQASSEGGGPGIQATYAVFYLFFIVLIALRNREPLALPIGEKWITLLWLWALASTAWSPIPGTTLRRSVALLGTTVTGLFVATRFEPKQQLRIVAHCIGLAALASLVACLVFPDYAIAKTGEWTGVFYQKNALGHPMALGVLCFAFLAVSQPRRRLRYVLMAGFCGFLLLMSRSVTATLVCAVMLIALRFRKVIILGPRRMMGFVLAFIAVGMPIGIYAIQHMDVMLKSLGRDATLTGRIPLWNAVLDEIATRPLRGFGYSAFWFSGEGARVQAKLGWQVIHSHNGYFELTLGLGLIGTALLVVSMMINISRGIRVAQAAETIEDFWPLFYLLFALADNVTEAWFVTTNSLLWMLFVANSYWIVRRTFQPMTEEDVDVEPMPAFAPGTPTSIGPAESANFA